VILTFPYHDPDGKYNFAFQRQFKKLASTFDAICISVTPTTGKKNVGFVRSLKSKGCVVFKNPAGSTIGDQAREALRLALKQSKSEQPILFGFLDRILFALETEWRWYFLQDLQVYQTAEFLVFERSEAAWDTHPANYHEVENMMSRMLELLYGRSIEVMPCALLMNRSAASTIMEQSTSPGFEVWAEWTLLAIKNNVTVTTKQVDWLAWEHPHWEKIDPAELRRSRETSRDEAAKRIAMHARVMSLLTEERFRHL
jgi:hypothetical protein